MRWRVDPTEGPRTRRDSVRRAARWLFVNRQTDGFTVVQWPNLALWAYLVCAVVLRLGPGRGGVHSVVRVLSDVAVVIWSADEIVRGVNPFRRLLGAAVLGLSVYGFVTH
jgi:hypothetical protein